MEPTCAFAMGWSCVVGFLIIYCVVTVPYRMAFGVPAEGGWYVFELAIDVFFLVDIVLNFHMVTAPARRASARISAQPASSASARPATLSALRPLVQLPPTTTPRAAPLATKAYRDPATLDWEFRRKYISRNYLHGWFVIDFVSAIPLDGIMDTFAMIGVR